MGAGKRLVILDRDGTLIDIVRDEETGFVGVAFHPRQVQLLRGVVPGLLKLRDAGYRFAMATNQPAPAKGQFSEAAVHATNAAVVAELAEAGVMIEHVAVCMHHPNGGTGGREDLIKDCSCRKPRPGLLRECVDVLNADLNQTWMVGDSPGDVQAGVALGVQTALLFDTKRCELCPLRALTDVGAKPTVHGSSLLAVADAILSSPS